MQRICLIVIRDVVGRHRRTRIQHIIPVRHDRDEAIGEAPRGQIRIQQDNALPGDLAYLIERDGRVHEPRDTVYTRYTRA